MTSSLIQKVRLHPAVGPASLHPEGLHTRQNQDGGVVRDQMPKFQSTRAVRACFNWCQIFLTRDYLKKTASSIPIYKQKLINFLGSR